MFPFRSDLIKIWWHIKKLFWRALIDWLTGINVQRPRGHVQSLSCSYYLCGYLLRHQWLEEACSVYVNSWLYLPYPPNYGWSTLSTSAAPRDPSCLYPHNTAGTFLIIWARAMHPGALSPVQTPLWYFKCMLQERCRKAQPCMQKKDFSAHIFRITETTLTTQIKYEQ